MQGYLLTTATADWTTYDTIGGLRPTATNELRFHPGHFLDAITQQRWLVIDELNRSNFDRAFAQLFTVLSGQSVVPPYQDPDSGKPIALVVEDADPPGLRDCCSVITIPASWRVIATMNVCDARGRAAQDVAGQLTDVDDSRPRSPRTRSRPRTEPQPHRC